MRVFEGVLNNFSFYYLINIFNIENTEREKGRKNELWVTLVG